MNKLPSLSFACLLILMPALSVLAQAPFVHPAEDIKHLGPPERFLFWTPAQQVAGYRNIEQIYPTRKIKAGNNTLPLPEAKRDLSDFRYQVGDDAYGVDDFMRHNNVAGLLVVKDGKVIVERYGLGNDVDSLWVSFSVAKSVVSMLVGAAIQDGYIAGADEKVTAYLPRLKGSSYDDATIATVLQMSSGAAWNETYDDPESDVNNMPAAIVDMFRHLGGKERVAPPGERFNYNTGETNLVGAILRAAIGNNLATYLTHKIWQPFGMQADANWMTHGVGGGELGGCCISATLRDYGRLGLFALADGTLPDGTRVLPDGWMDKSTTPSKGYDGYGYLWWLWDDKVYSALGIFGQSIYIDPAKALVIVTHSAWSTAVGEEYSAHRRAFFQALAISL